MTVAILILLGLCFGSFVNALVWRLRQTEVKSKKPKAKSRELSILNGRSMCPECRHMLAWYDLIPVVSWLTLQGKCRYCKKPISWQYPVVELSTAILFILSYAFWPSSLLSLNSYLFLAFWLVLLTGFMALVVYDLRWMLLPNKIIYPLIVLAIIQVIIKATVMHQGISTIQNAGLGVLIVGGMFFALFQVSGGNWIGGGDVKLGALLGLLAGGPFNSLLLIFLASFLGCLAALPLLLAKKATAGSKIPFGPFLILAAILTQLFSDPMLKVYLGLFKISA